MSLQHACIRTYLLLSVMGTIQLLWLALLYSYCHDEPSLHVINLIATSEYSVNI